MRVLLVGSPAERDALRAQLEGAIEIAGEFSSVAAARAADIDADAILLSPERIDDRDGLGGRGDVADDLHVRLLRNDESNALPNYSMVVDAEHSNR
jgi:hypothetical protein